MRQAEADYSTSVLRARIEGAIEQAIALLDALDEPFTDLEPEEDEAVDDRPIDEPHQDMEPDDEDAGIDDVPHDQEFAA